MRINEFSNLKDNLNKGFFVDNLYEMSRLCDRLAKDSPDAPVFYVLRSVFLDFAEDWDDRPLLEDKATQVQQIVETPIRNVIEGLDKKKSKEVLFDLLTKLVDARIRALSLP